MCLLAFCSSLNRSFSFGERSAWYQRFCMFSSFVRLKTDKSVHAAFANLKWLCEVPTIQKYIDPNATKRFNEIIGIRTNLSMLDIYVKWT